MPQLPMKIFDLSGDSRLITNFTRFCWKNQVLHLLDFKITDKMVVVAYEDDKHTSHVAYYWPTAEDVLRGADMIPVPIDGLGKLDEHPLSFCTVSTTGTSAILVAEAQVHSSFRRVHVLQASATEPPTEWRYFVFNPYPNPRFDAYSYYLPNVFDPTCTWMATHNSGQERFKVDLPLHLASNVTVSIVSGSAPIDIHVESLPIDQSIPNVLPMEETDSSFHVFRWISRDLIVTFDGFGQLGHVQLTIM
mmetsp:Transcript_27707/g.45033  ORF Transcript_27707/g.45033 Transcript_27707/m.45033 type:complete len:248 (-) Transcript_27707:11-754(-)